MAEKPPEGKKKLTNHQTQKRGGRGGGKHKRNPDYKKQPRKSHGREKKIMRRKLQDLLKTGGKKRKGGTQVKGV